MSEEIDKKEFPLRCQNLLDFLTNHMATEENDAYVWSAVLVVLSSCIIRAQSKPQDALYSFLKALTDTCQEDEKECNKTNT